MKRLTVLLLIVAAFALTGCNGETSITSGYGSSVLSGEVVLSNAASPAGVEVSVRGTGMTATLGEDGRFAFANIPAEAVLDFRRAADGIEASLAVDASAGSSLTIELGQVSATAKKSGRRRAGARGGEKVQELEGVIRTAAADSIVVFTSHKEEVTVGLTAETVIRKGRTALTPADLTVDTRVHVKAKLADGAYTAVLVIVQNPSDDEEGEEETPRPSVKEYQGSVVSATATELVLFTSKKVEVKFAITEETEIRKGSTMFDMRQILTGMIVHVKATANADGTNTANLIIVQRTR